MDDVHSFEECCELTKEAQLLQPDRGINRFSYNGHMCVTLFSIHIILCPQINCYLQAEFNMLIIFSFRCYFKCGGTQDFRGGDFWSSTEDISTCSCS